MKARYVLLIAFLSFIINGVSLYNLLIGYISLFIMLIVSIPNVFIKVIEIGKSTKARGVDNIIVETIMDFEKNTHSKGIYIFGVIFVYIAGGLLLVFQIYQYDYIDGLVTSNVSIPIYYSVVTYLIGVGYVLFGASLIMMIIHFRRIFREALMFQKTR